MSKKPQDMLEFLRRNREELARALPPPPLPQTGGPEAKKPRPPATRRTDPKGPAAPAGRTDARARKPASPAGPRPEAGPAQGGAALPTITVPVRTAWMAGGGAALLVLIAFWIGMKLGGGPENPDNARLATPGGPAAFWTVRVATFDEDEQSRAESVVEAIRSHRASRGLPALDVAIRPLKQDGKLVVTIGNWSGEPKDDAQAGEVLEYVRRLQDKETGRPLFDGAYFWQTPR